MAKYKARIHDEILGWASVYVEATTEGEAIEKVKETTGCEPEEISLDEDD